MFSSKTLYGASALHIDDRTTKWYTRPHTAWVVGKVVSRNRRKLRKE